MHNLTMIVILEPFADSSQINSYRIQLNMDKAHSNPNAKIWLFWAGELECNVLDTDEQHTTYELKHLDYPEKFIISYVYAKCKDQLRRPLWDNLMQVSETNLPWCTIGDFNVITSTQEKQGGREYNMNKSFEFISVIEPCGLIDIGYNGQPFTWCNQRAEEARIWKRLDRAMVNDKWLESMPQTTITHLPSVGSDHCPLLLEMTTRQDQVTRYFKFLNCWTENPNFYATVKECWEKEVSGNPMWSLHTKMRRLTNTLSNWSRVEYGDIFAKAKEYEEQVRGAEETLITANTEENRSKLHNINAQYIRYLKLEQSILKQKTQLHWFKEGDANTKYFHALMRGRKRRLFIHKICTDEGDWIQGDDNIAKEACQYFQNIFTGHTARISEAVLQCIPRMVTQDQNQALDSRVTLVKHVLQSIPIHTMAAISPPKTTIKYLKNITADFFWGMDKERKKYHWASWETLSYPCDDGGIGGETPDEAIWTPADSGQFSISSAWEIIRKKQAKDLINTIIWHKNVPFKVSFFIWRALRSKLPTNEKLASFGIEPVNCYCCHRPGRDDIDHILVSGNFANHIWKVHTALLGIEHSYTTLRCLLMKWKSSQHSSEVHKLLHQALPILICWNLWKNRCSAKYGGKQSSIGRVKHELKVIPVGWDKPIMGLYKLNTDGSALTNPGKIGGGGILRDGQGNLVYAYAIPLGFGTSNKAEIQTAAYGVNWCVQHGYKKIILDVDSELLSKWLNHNSPAPWQLQQYIQELKNISSQCEYFQCKHTFREANCTADHLSKWSHKQDIIQHFYTYQQLPGASRGSYILEKMGMQNFRRKRLRRIKQPP
ncbi:hypothetical protein MTR67_000894 [Solanum verrucosum]|uniref:RNase H type-1 domain-containing protein n=1 Tax=Solanum verrucosum TaxID=315347 RepID=A0AAF0T7D2_SOLVR|nr:hypothetical protein MTR67_000894 [Solanum verrucosum]